MMTTFKLHGALGATFGEDWQLDVNSVAEGIRAIESMTRRFCKFLIDKDKEGIGYRIVFGEKDHEGVDEITGPVPSNKVVHIIPVIQGAGENAAWWQIVAGVALVVVSFFIPAAWAAAAPYLAGAAFSLGASLALGGIVQLLTPHPDMDMGDDKLKPSSTFSGVRNTSQQGLPVPIAYGELIVGSHLISLGMRNEEVRINPPEFPDLPII